MNFYVKELWVLTRFLKSSGIVVDRKFFEEKPKLFKSPLYDEKLEKKLCFIFVYEGRKRKLEVKRIPRRVIKKAKKVLRKLDM